jgi:hypothetical protein
VSCNAGTCEYSTSCLRSILLPLPIDLSTFVGFSIRLLQRCYSLDLPYFHRLCRHSKVSLSSFSLADPTTIDTDPAGILSFVLSDFNNCGAVGSICRAPYNVRSHSLLPALELFAPPGDSPILIIHSKLN